MKKLIAGSLIFLTLMRPTASRADMWGGDIPLLIEIVANTAAQLTQLKSILGTGADTLSYIRDINDGIRTALRVIQSMNPKLDPGVLSQLNNVNQVLSVVEQLYGKIPNTSEAKVQQLTDQSVAEAIHLHNEAFRYAAQLDPEVEKIKSRAQDVSPLGAGRLTAQSLGVLIHVMNQILRTNAAILKMQGEQVALENKKEKLNSQQFKMQYEQLSKAFGSLGSSYSLPSLSNP